MNFNIDESVFEASLKEKLGAQYAKALEIFRKIGKAKALDLIQIFLYAIENKQQGRIMADLEKIAKGPFHSKFDLEEIDNALERLKKELGI